MIRSTVAFDAGEVATRVIRMHDTEVNPEEGDANLGMDLPSSVLAGCVVRALTGSPALLFRESTGFVSTAFTDESPASVALLSPAWAAAEELALPCALAPDRSALTAPCPAAWPEAPTWLWDAGVCAGGLWAEAVAIASMVAKTQSTAEMYRVVMADNPPVTADVLSATAAQAQLRDALGGEFFPRGHASSIVAAACALVGDREPPGSGQSPNIGGCREIRAALDFTPGSLGSTWNVARRAR